MKNRLDLEKAAERLAREWVVAEPSEGLKNVVAFGEDRLGSAARDLVLECLRFYRGVLDYRRDEVNVEAQLVRDALGDLGEFS